MRRQALLPRTACILLITAAVTAAHAASPNASLTFSITPEVLNQRCSETINRANTRLDAIEGIRQNRQGFRNVVLAFNHILSDLKADAAALTFLKYVSTDSAVRDESYACETRIEKFLIAAYSRNKIYLAVKEFSSRNAGMEEHERRLLTLTLEDFQRHGQALEYLERARFKLLREMLIELKGKFGENLSHGQGYLAITQKETEGLPADYLNRLEKGNYGTRKVTLDYTDYFPFMQYARSEDARKRLEIKMNNRATPENVIILEEILSLRRRIAAMLNFPAYNDFALSGRMAKDPKKVEDFLKNLRKTLTKKAQQELNLLLDLKKKDFPGADTFYSWDFPYYHDQMRKETYGLEDEALRAFFPMEKVLREMLRIYEELLDIQFTEVTPAEAWHPDVRRFEVWDNKKLLGHFYLDLYPRDGKYKHAAAFTLIEGQEEENSAYRNPVAAMVANFDKPTAERPSLLTHSEVKTLFHEFGHIVHQTLSRGHYARFSATRTPRDFIEAPSQMLELWAWDPAIIVRISSHYKDGRKIPLQTAKNIAASRNLNAGLRYLRQVFYATIDQLYHDSKGGEDTTEAYRQLYNEISLITLAPETHPQAGFGYLMGYAASYYGYMWSEGYAADMFSLFKKQGLTHKELGLQYRKTLLEPGYAQDPEQLLKTFLGRAPDEKSLEKSLGF